MGRTSLKLESLTEIAGGSVHLQLEVGDLESLDELDRRLVHDLLGLWGDHADGGAVLRSALAHGAPEEIAGGEQAADPDPVEVAPPAAPEPPVVGGGVEVDPVPAPVSTPPAPRTTGPGGRVAERIRNELTLLRALDDAGGCIEHDRSATQVLIDASGLNVATARRLIIAMAEADDIDRYVTDDGKNRTVKIELTDQGRARLEEAA